MKNKLTHLIILTALLNCLYGQSRTINVPNDYSTIQQGINNAVNGDTVLVAPGYYYENINFKGKDILLTSYFLLSWDTSFIKSTIIDGSRPKNVDTASCVLFINHEGPAAILQGFTITGGKGTEWTDEHGAGKYREGGGILSALSSPTIRFNIITDNRADSTTGVTSAGGGGIRTGDGNISILNNIIENNKGRYGAGITLNYTGAIVKNNIITGNSGGQDYGGGALWMNSDGPDDKIIENNTFVNNKVVAVYVWQGNSIIRNCIIWADKTVSTVQIIAKSGGPTVSYSDVYGGYTGEGNIFVNPEFSDTSYVLTSSSPCIDQGNRLGEDNNPENINHQGYANLPSKGTIRNDMGAYGGPGSFMISNFKTASFPTGINKNIEVDKHLNLKLYPNPGSKQITMKYSLPIKQEVKISLYDFSGKEVMSLIDNIQSAGNYSKEFQTDKLQRGIYIVKIDTGSENRIQKLVLN